MRRSRLVILLVSALLITLVVTGGILSHAAVRDTSYQSLRVFEDVVNLVMNNYVEEVDTTNIMQGAMHGLADGLDPESSYVTADQVGALTRGEPLPRGEVGLELTRQYYLRVIAAREGSPAARAGVRSGDFVRQINDEPTRDMSVFTGTRVLRGAPGTKVKLMVIRGNAAEPHEVELVREEARPLTPTVRSLQPGLALLRIPEFTGETAKQLRERLTTVRDPRLQHLIIDLRSTAEGPLEAGLTAARLFVAEGTLGAHQTRSAKSPIAARAGDGSISVPVTLLVDTGTAGAAELFAAALNGNGRAKLVGERTIGRAGMQELIKLPDGTGLLMTTSRYLTPKDAVIHGKGLTPDVAVDGPDIEYGAAPPSNDPILEKAIELASQKEQEEKPSPELTQHTAPSPGASAAVDNSAAVDKPLATPPPQREASAASVPQPATYTVTQGDTLAKIAKQHLGTSAAYRSIFELNQDQLTDPNKIRVGQVLKLPDARE
jgi:carboxyl-terminal processing protease